VFNSQVTGTKPLQVQYVVQQLLGHANPRTTQRYAHLEQETLAKAAEVAAETLKRAVDQR
jgi:site-specific recombinase XerC